MNKPRRKKITEVMALIETYKDHIESLKGTLEEIRDDEQDTYDAWEGTNLENSERFEICSNALDALEEAVGNLEDAITNMEEAVNA